jgi:Holliday junction resolvase RusA-like endonuclease
VSVNSVAFNVNGDPVGQGAMRLARFGDRVVIRHSESAKLRGWRNAVKWSARQALGSAAVFAPDGPVLVRANFRMRRPKRCPRALPCVRPDLDHLARALGDALTDVMFHDDAQVVEWSITKTYGDTPGVHVEVVAVPK